jgi:hypothetical protein
LRHLLNRVYILFLPSGLDIDKTLLKINFDHGC